MSEETLIQELVTTFEATEGEPVAAGGSPEAAERAFILMVMDELLAYGQNVWAPFHATIDGAFPLPKGQRDTREYMAVQATREKVKTLGRLYVARFSRIRSHQECAEMALRVKEQGRLAPCDQVEGITVPVLEPWERRKGGDSAV